MLHVPVLNEFQGNLNNFGSTLTEAGFGTSVTTGGANTKSGSTTTLLTLTEDAFGLAICFAGGATSATVKQYLVDIYFGSVIAIPNLLANSPSLNLGGYWYYFPIFIPNGTVIGARAQCNAATQTIRIGVKAMTKPRRNDSYKVGSRVRAYGVTTASSNGTAHTPGTSTMSTYALLAAITAGEAPWWWQAGLATNDTTMTTPAYSIDVGVGSAVGNASPVLQDVICMNNNTAEQMGKTIGTGGAARTPAQNIYVRAAGLTAAPDSNVSIAVYALE
jgi:hypothetical protein